MTDTLLRAKDLTKVYCLPAEEIYAVNGTSLEINKGDFIAIMGPSGSGKTTLLDIIGCLDSISSGELELLGKDVSNVKEKDLVKIRRGNIGFIFQDFLLISSLTALENVELALYFSGVKYDKKLSGRMLEKVGMGHRLNHLPKELSGGERQRVAIARALVTSPKLLIADEPTGNLDTKTSGEIFELFKKINEEERVTIIVATHDEKLGAEAKRIIYLKDGKVE